MKNNSRRLQNLQILINPKTPGHILHNLLSDNNHYEKYIAKQINIDFNITNSLLKEEWWVRKNIAANPNISIKFLEILCQDSSKFVRRAVAKNKNTPNLLLNILSYDLDKFVRSAVLTNPNIEKNVLINLTKDTVMEIRSQAFELLLKHKFCKT